MHENLFGLDEGQTTLVAVHGVGDAVPGAILRDLSKSLGKEQGNDSAAFERVDLMLEGEVYPRLRADNVGLGKAQITEVIEANWADVFRPGGGKLGLVKYLAMLIIGMRNISVAPIQGQEKASFFLGKLYWFFLERIALWAVFLAMTLMLLASCGSDHQRMQSGIMIASCVGVFVIGWFAGKYMRGYRWGWAWIPVFAAVGALFIWPSFLPQNFWIESSAKFYTAVQFTTGVLLLLAFAQSLIVTKGTWSRRLARGGFLWLPFVLITMALVVLWVLLLKAGSKIEGFETWRVIFTENLHYDLWISEVSMAAAVLVTFLLFPLIGLLGYFVKPFRESLRLGASPGQVVHNMFAVILTVGPITLLGALLVILWSILRGDVPKDGQDIINAYVASSARLAAFLPLLLPQIRNIMDIVGDIVFHIQPKEKERSPGDRQPKEESVCSRDKTISRLKVLLQWIRTHRPDDQIVILAHSQGSIVSFAVLSEPGSHQVDRLITIGCPLDTLYYRYLSDEYRARDPRTFIWRNFYCDGDYIGGSVPGVDADCPLGAGDHTGYWRDERLFAAIASRLHLSDCIERKLVPSDP